MIYQCNGKFKKTERCKTPKLNEDEIIEKFLKAVNILLSDRASLTADCELIYEMLCDVSDIDKQISKAHTDMTLYVEMMKAHVRKNASTVQSQKEYEAEAKHIEEMYAATVNKLEKLEEEKTKKRRKSKEIRAFTSDIKTQPLAISQWDERLWITLLDSAIVHRDRSISFHFKNGQEIHC